MRTTWIMVVFLLVLGLALSCRHSRQAEEVSVLVVTGGHSYDTTEFVELFRSMTGIRFDTLLKPFLYEMTIDEITSGYDVIVFYDMQRETLPGEKEKLPALTEHGTGLVFLHHSLVASQDWEEYTEIIGGKYHIAPYTTDSSILSAYRHDIELDIEVLDPFHPVTEKMNDFTILDEGYSNIEILPGNTCLLSVSHPDCAPCTAWARTYKQSKVVYLLHGHDRLAYENPSFREVLANAIRWTSGI